jgi:hypothetical protein
MKKLYRIHGDFKPSQTSETEHGCAGVPIVTVKRHSLAPPSPPYAVADDSMILWSGPGWSVELHDDPTGGIGIAGHFRHEDTAWQQALAIARRSGWRVVRDPQANVGAGDK